MSVTWPYEPKPQCTKREGCIYSKHHHGPCMTEAEEWAALAPEAAAFYRSLEAVGAPTRLDLRPRRWLDAGWERRLEADRERQEHQSDRFRYMPANAR